ncbi:hypothetical protein K505DRAFT_371666 [Melanomma pulvis-pyrius CBS 109.77]|uniref:P-loop containing nucleoside triphosphate hydrolase protein n=1 Tax=Melanomma pulvis-pyrius CBS 109.77 TaxID=1314802 RepID=A0A6A6XRD7_9PLEO|nr:hypothetical protein K505DRAFT_371666 [Melanomma pulvis-pyrius CBS 109.77]
MSPTTNPFALLSEKGTAMDPPRSTRPALIFVVGPPKAGKTTFSKSIAKRSKQFDLVSADEVTTVGELVDEVFPRDEDVATRPCVVDGFPLHHAQWHEFTKGNGVFADKETKGAEGEREGENEEEEGRKAPATQRDKGDPRRVLVVSLQCLESLALTRWRAQQKGKIGSGEEEKESEKFELQRKGIEAMLANMRGNRLMEVVELLPAGVGEGFEEAMKRWMPRIEGTATWRKCGG